VRSADEMRSEIARSAATLDAEVTRLDALIQAGRSNTLDLRAAASLRGIRDDLAAASRRLRRLDLPAETVPADAKQGRLVSRLSNSAPFAGDDTFRTKVKLKPASEPPAAITAVSIAAASAPPGDDLTRIRGIDAKLAAQLASHGVTSFAAIASWHGDDVRRLAQNLNVGRQISRQNWIEQAALLRGPIAPPPVPLVAATPIAPAPDPDRLDLIGGIDRPTSQALQSLGVSRWAEIAAWTRADIDRVEICLGTPGVIAKQGWIEQAALLATGHLTAHATRALRNTFDALVAPPAAEPLAARQFVVVRIAPPAPLVTAPGHTERGPNPMQADPPVPSSSPPVAEITPDAALFADAPIAVPDGPVATPTPDSIDGGFMQRTKDRMAALEDELDALISARAVPPADHPAGPRFTPRVDHNIEDDEFPELTVDEADVEIVVRAAKPARPRDQQPVSPVARGLISQLKGTAPLADIDGEEYAAYHDAIEEATVVIIRKS
jgi:predicted flap endonuclease-1-like 5' DNA nuclease